MMTLVARLLPILLILLAVQAEGQEATRAGLAIVGGRVLTMEGDAIPEGVVLTKGRKIERVGALDEVDIPAGYTLIDASGCVVCPGFIELHNHSAGSDLQSRIYQVNPGSRVLDNMELDTPALRFSVAGGVTCVLNIPGSANNMSGWGVVRKTWGRSAKDVLVKFPGALKIAQAGNPERSGGELGLGSMGMNWLIRNVLLKGKEYHQAWCAYEQGRSKKKPAKIVSMESLRGLFRKEYPIVVHTQMMAVVQMTVRILHDELGLDVVIDHGTFDGYLNGPLVVARGIPVANGPRQFFWDRTQGRMLGLAAAWHELGVADDAITVNTDAPVVPEEELQFQASMAVRMGLPEDVALLGLTLGGARMLRVDDRLGSLKAGKDADVVVWNGDPLDPRSRTKVVIINGEVAYDSARDGIRW